MLDTGSMKEAEVNLGTANCQWDVSVINDGDSCEVMTQFKDSNDQARPGWTASSAGGTADPVELFVNGPRATDTSVSNNAVAEIEFAVSETCTTTMISNAMVSVSVTDATPSADHDNTTFTVEIADGSAPGSGDRRVTTGCSSNIPDVTLTLASGTATGAIQDDQGMALDLIGTRYEGAQCEYEITFPSCVTSGDGSTKLRLNSTTPDPATLSSLTTNATVTGAYVPICAPIVALENKTAAGAHTNPASQGTVMVTATPVSTTECTSTAPINAPGAIAAAGSDSVTLTELDCAWTISFHNTASDCVVTAQLKQPDGSNVPGADASATTGTDGTAGTLTIYADNSGADFEARSADGAGGGTQVGSIEFTVSTADDECTTYFPATVSLTVQDVEAATHDGSVSFAYARTTSITHANCSAAGMFEVDLSATAATRAGTLYTDTQSLIHDQLGGGEQLCTYDVTFTTPLSVGSPAVSLERLGTTTSTTVSNSSRTAAVTYDAVRDTRFDIRNITSSTAGHTGNEARRGVKVFVNPAAGSDAACSTTDTHALGDETEFDSLAAGATAGTPVAGSSMTLNLGREDCTYEISYENTNDDCQVEPQLKLPGGGNIDYTDADDNDNEFTLYTNGRRLRIADTATAMVVGSIDFNVPDPSGTGSCTVNIANPMVEISVTDALEGTHAGTEFTVSLARVTAADNSHLVCTDPVADVTVTLGAKDGTNMDNTTTAEAVGTALVGSHYDGTDCSYDVTFPTSKNSVGSDPNAADSDDVSLNRTSITPAASRLSASATKVTGNYAADRPPSKVPVLTLARTSDTGSKEAASPYFTQDPNPAFNVTFVDPADNTPSTVSGSTVTVTATMGTAPAIVTVSRSLTTGSNALSVSVVFTALGPVCTRNGMARQSCALDDGEWTVTVSNRDTATSAPATDSIIVRVDNARPTVTITASPASPAVEATSTVTFTVSDTISDATSTTEEVSGFEFSEVDHSGAGGRLVAASFPTSGTTYTATFTAGNIYNSTYMIEVPENIFVDRAGNMNAATASAFTLTVARPASWFELHNSAAPAHSNDARFTAQFRVRFSSCRNADNTADTPAVNGTRIYTVVAGVTLTVPIPRTNRCSLDIRHNPAASDCQATTDPDSGSNRTLERFVRPNLNHPIAASPTIPALTRVTYNVSCDTYFDGTVGVLLQDTDSANHLGRTITARLARSGGPATGCSADTDVPISLGAATPSGTPYPRSSAGANVTGLIDVPRGENTSCEYTITYPQDDYSASDTLRAVGQGAATAVLSAASPSVSRTYEIQRSAIVTLRNATDPSVTNHDPATRNNVVVQVVGSFDNDPSCPAAATGSPFTVNAGATRQVDLGSADCDWDLGVINTADDCAVSTQFKNANGGAVGSAGALTLYSVAGPRVSNADDGSDIVAEVELTVGTDCSSTISGAMVAVSVSDGASGGHTGSTFTVSIGNGVVDVGAPQKVEVPVGCSRDIPDVTLTLGADGTATEAVVDANGMALIGARHDTLECEYPVSFPNCVSSLGSTGGRLLRSGITPTAAALTSTNTTITGSYAPVCAPMVSLVNQTAAGDHTRAGQGTVTVTAAPVVTGPCTDTAPLSSPSAIAAAGSDSVTLTEQDCEWTITFSNTNADCVVTAQLFDTASPTAGPISSAVSTGADGMAGTLTIYVDNSNNMFEARSADGADGGTQVGSIEFTVSAANSGECTTYFPGKVELTVTDTDLTAANRNHTGKSIGLMWAPVGSRSDCSAGTMVSVPLGTADRDGEAFESPAVDLIDDPAGSGTACSYTVTFTEDITVATPSPSVDFKRTSAAVSGTWSDSSRTVSATYDVVRNAVLTIDNVTTATHSGHADFASRPNVIVTVAAGTDCAQTPPSGITSPFLPSTPAEPVSFGQVACAWVVSYRNVNDDCVVEPQLKDPAGGNITYGDADDNDGEFVVSTTANRRVVVEATVSDGSGGTTTETTVVGSIDFNVPDSPAAACTTFFTGTVELEVSDTDSSSTARTHTGNSIEVAYAPPAGRNDCSPAGNFTVALGAVSQRSSATTFPGTARLIDVPVGATACVYTVTFDASETIGTGGSALTLERLSTGRHG